MSDDLKNLFQELEKAKKESVKEEQENLNKTASSLKTTVGVIKQNEISNLFEGLEQASVEADIEIKKKLELNEKEKEKLNDFSALMEKVGSLSEKTEEENVSQITEVVTEFVEPEIIEEVVEEKKPTTIIDEIVSNLDDMGQKTEVKEQLDEIQSLRKEFEQYKKTLQNQVTKGLATSSGGGEVRLEFLDDVQRSTAKVNDKFLKYDSTAGLFVGSDVTATTNTEEVQDIVGAMFSSNTETGITATYQDGDGTIDLVVGTLNQDTTGNAATATALATARNIGGVSFDGTGNINLPGVNTSGTQDTSGNAATATALATARNIGGVSFDGTGNINLPGVNTSGTQDTSGNAATATALATARTIHGVSFDGTANIDLSEVVQDTVGAMFSSNTETGITVTYQDGDGTIDLVVGTLNQDTTGNAATATALETARTIHGVSFDGTGNIDLSEVIQDTVGAMFSSNTETNISATYQDADGTIDLVVGDTTGNAATATALETARNIGGVSFDGTANINLPGVNTSGTQDTSGNAATATALATARTIHGVSFDGTGNIDLTEVIEDTVGAMVSSNTETGITVTYQDGDGTIDFALAAAQTTITSLLATDIKIGEDDQTKIDFETANEIHFYANNVNLISLTNANSGDAVLTVPTADKNFTIKGTDDSSGITALDIDMAAAGDATFNNKIIAVELDISGDVDIDGTLEADAITVNGSALASSATTDTTNASNIGSGTLAAARMAAAQTAITSIFNTSLAIGYGSSHANINFGTDNQITFDIDGTGQVVLKDGMFHPVTDSDVDLGKSDKYWKDAYIDTITTTGLITSGSNLVIADAGNIGSASDTDAISIASTGAVTFSQRDIHSSGITIANGETIGSVGDSDAITISTAGNVTLAEVVTTSKGVKFPATQVASTDANTLDDYEEGTYTPTISFAGGSTGVAYNSTNTGGFYQKIGRMVKVDFRITLTSKGSSTGFCRVSLPFAASTQARPGSQVIPYGVNFNNFSNGTVVNASVVGQGATAGLAECDLYHTLSGSSLTDVNFNNNSDFIGNLWYYST